MPTKAARAFNRNQLPTGVKPPSGSDPRTLGPYRVVGRIGAGGMGAVYAGLDGQGGSAAVKVVHPHIAVDPEFLARFAREVEMVSRVRAVCAPAFLGADVRAETPWLATEYVPGSTLRKHVRENGPLTGGMLTALAVGLAEALVAIHRAGVVHRDLKPGNVILSPDGPKVLDFGIARAVDATALTTTGGMFGTPGWMAPEQYVGEEATDRSDMFMWACMVLFAATGEDPFGRGPLNVVSHRTRTEEPDLEGLPAELADVVRSAFAKDPAERPTAEQVLTRLTDGWNATQMQSVPTDDPTLTAPALIEREWRGVEAPSLRRVRRSGTGWWISGSAALVALIVAGVWLLPLPGRDDAEVPTGGDAAENEEAATAEGGLRVETAPEDVDVVVEEAIALALDASSFLTYEHGFTNDVGDTTPRHYRYTEDPEPAFSSLSLLGPLVSGYVAYGADLQEVVRFDERREGAGPEQGRTYYRPDGQGEVIDPFGEWEQGLRGLENLLGEEAKVTYEGTSGVPASELPEELAGETDFAERSGHHYTGTVIDSFYEREPAEIEFDLWISEEGFPVRFTRVEYTDEPTEFEDELLEFHSHLDFMLFNEPVEVEIPDPSEIEDRS